MKITRFGLMTIITIIIAIAIVIVFLEVSIYWENNQWENNQSIDSIDLTVPIDKNQTLSMNTSSVISQLKKAGFDAKQNDADAGIIAKITNDTGTSVLFISTNSTNYSNSYLNIIWYPSGKYVVNEQSQKKIIWNEALWVGDICGLTIDWSEAKWTISYAD